MVKNLFSYNSKILRVTQLAAILKDSGATGEFKLGNLQISIIQLKEYTNHLEE